MSDNKIEAQNGTGWICIKPNFASKKASEATSNSFALEFGEKCSNDKELSRCKSETKKRADWTQKGEKGQET